MIESIIGSYGDLSNIHFIDSFCNEIELVAKECFRILKPGKFCAILIGDTRRKKFYIPLAFKVMERFLKAGFVLREDIIKVQHNCKATGFWVKKSKLYNFLLIMHEHVFVFYKQCKSAKEQKYGSTEVQKTKIKGSGRSSIKACRLQQGVLQFEK